MVMARPDPTPPGEDRFIQPLERMLSSLPLAVWTTDLDLRVTSVLGSASEDLGMGSGTGVGDGFGDRSPDAVAAHRKSTEGRSTSFEAATETTTYRIQVEPLRDEEGEIVGAVGVALDISDRKRMEQTLRQVMRGYRAIAELTSEFAYALRVLDDGGVIFEWVTEGFEQLTGFDRHEANAMGPMAIVHPEDMEATQRVLAGAILGETVTSEHRIVTRTGETRWIRSHGMPEMDGSGRVIRIFGAVQDVSEQKATEADLSRALDDVRRTDRERLRLLVHLVRAQDEERKRIAEGIHDDSIQMMATVGLRLEAMARKAKDPAARRDAEVLHGLVDDAVSRLRTLLFELAPPALRDGGLGVAISQLLERIAEHEDDLAFSIDNRLPEEPPEESRLLLFRLAQEALTNVRKHARASRVEVRLDEQDGGVLLTISDNGVGFSPSEPPPPGHLGLVAMRERAETAHGWWRVESEPGSGTTVAVWLPVGAQLDPSRSS